MKKKDNVCGASLYSKPCSLHIPDTQQNCRIWLYSWKLVTKFCAVSNSIKGIRNKKDFLVDLRRLPKHHSNFSNELYAMLRDCLVCELYDEQI